MTGESRVRDEMERLSEALVYRTEYAERSFEDRTELIDIAMEYLPDCYLFGYGPAGCRARVGQRSGNAVHVYYIGLVLLAGFPGAVLLMIGFAKLFVDLWRTGEREFAAYFASHLLILAVGTVMFLSFQSLAIMVAGAALARSGRARKSLQKPGFTPTVPFGWQRFDGTTRMRKRRRPRRTRRRAA